MWNNSEIRVENPSRISLPQLQQEFCDEDLLFKTQKLNQINEYMENQPREIFKRFSREKNKVEKGDFKSHSYFKCEDESFRSFNLFKDFQIGFPLPLQQLIEKRVEIL